MDNTKLIGKLDLLKKVCISNYQLLEALADSNQIVGIGHILTTLENNRRGLLGIDLMIKELKEDKK